MVITFLLLGLVFYFLPSITAYEKKHKNVAGIFVLNFFLGWSVIGWVLSLVWAFTKE